MINKALTPARMSKRDAARVLEQIQAGVLDELLPASAVASLHRQALTVAHSAAWGLRTDDDGVLRVHDLQNAKRVRATEIDTAICRAQFRPGNERVVVVGRTASGELAIVTRPLSAHGWVRIHGKGGLWRHEDAPGFVADGEMRASHVWLDGAPIVAWDRLS